MWEDDKQKGVQCGDEGSTTSLDASINLVHYSQYTHENVVDSSFYVQEKVLILDP